MTKELKTLKDLEEKYEKIREENRRERLNSIDSEVKFNEAEGILKGLKLSKREAIKRAKYFKKQFLETGNYYWEGRFVEDIDFFNITEENF